MDKNPSFRIDDDNDEVRTASPDKPSTLGNKMDEEEYERPAKPAKDKSKTIMLAVICVLGLALVGGGTYFLLTNKSRDEEIARIQAEKEAAEVAYQEDLAKQDMSNLESEFAGIESPRQMIITDSQRNTMPQNWR